MRLWHCKKKSTLVIALTSFAILFSLWMYMVQDDASIEKLSFEDPMVFYWWIFNAQPYYHKRRLCGIYECIFTNNPSLLHKAQTIFFDGQSINLSMKMPLPRRSTHIWALFYSESPQSKPLIANEEIWHHFNYTSTFSRYSDFPLSTSFLPNIHDLVTTKYLRHFNRKLDINYSPILFLQSDCFTMSGREEYVRKLMTFISIDSYGACLHNRDLPPRLREDDYFNNMYSSEILGFIANYKFMLSIENSVCEDYVTEKFWRPLIAGTIPIYFGSNTAKDWHPNNNSVIYINDFEDIESLADYIKEVAENETLYMEYMTHKSTSIFPISNIKLLNELLHREYMDYQTVHTAFECFMCRTLNMKYPDYRKTTNMSVYNCTYPPLHMKVNKMEKPRIVKNWHSIMAQGRCEAKVLNELWSANKLYTPKEAFIKLKQLEQTGQCSL